MLMAVHIEAQILVTAVAVRPPLDLEFLRSETRPTARLPSRSLAEVVVLDSVAGRRPPQEVLARAQRRVEAHDLIGLDHQTGEPVRVVVPEPDHEIVSRPVDELRRVRGLHVARVVIGYETCGRLRWADRRRGPAGHREQGATVLPFDPSRLYQIRDRNTERADVRRGVVEHLSDRSFAGCTPELVRVDRQDPVRARDARVVCQSGEQFRLEVRTIVGGPTELWEPTREAAQDR